MYVEFEMRVDYSNIGDQLSFFSHGFWKPLPEVHELSGYISAEVEPSCNSKTVTTYTVHVVMYNSSFPTLGHCQ